MKTNNYSNMLYASTQGRSYAYSEMQEFARNAFQTALNFMQNDQPIEAIKEVRAATGLGLKESKDLVEGLYAVQRRTKQVHVEYGVTYEPPEKVGDYRVFGFNEKLSTWQFLSGTLSSKDAALERGEYWSNEQGYTDVLAMQVVGRTKEVKTFKFVPVEG